MTEDQFEKLAQMIKGVHDEMVEGFDHIDTRFEQVDTQLKHIDIRFNQVDTRFDKMETELVYIRSELRDIRHDLDVLKERVTGHDGYTKEIDHVLGRVAKIEEFIEKHLRTQSVA